MHKIALLASLVGMVLVGRLLYTARCRKDHDYYLPFAQARL